MVSMPCTGGAPMQRINWNLSEEHRKKIRAHWKLFDRLWEQFEKLDKMLPNLPIIWEWPLFCDYWQRKKVAKKFRNMHYTIFDGCQFGLKKKATQDYLQKPWKLAALHQLLRFGFLHSFAALR